MLTGLAIGLALSLLIFLYVAAIMYGSGKSPAAMLGRISDRTVIESGKR
jgi:hypothetical protein